MKRDGESIGSLPRPPDRSPAHSGHNGGPADRRRSRRWTHVRARRDLFRKDRVTEFQPSRYVGEKITKSGEILLSHHHISLLHGLMDRPEGIALSVGDWLLASLPYGRRYLWTTCQSGCSRRPFVLSTHRGFTDKRLGAAFRRHCSRVAALSSIVIWRRASEGMARMTGCQRSGGEDAHVEADDTDA